MGLALFGIGEDNGSLQDYFDASAAGAAGVGLGEVRTADTVSTDALRSSTPVAAPGVGDAFGGVWGSLQGVLNTVTQTELSRYQAKRALPAGGDMPTPEPGPVAKKAAARNQSLLLIGGGVALVGLVLFLALRK